jgi:pyridoxine 5-phosphate synthase
VEAAINCQKFGAQGITVHPRPDERHIRRQDVFDIRPHITTEFNIEGYPGEDFIRLVIAVKAHQVTLVPDSITQLTSDHGWNTRENLSFLKEVIARFRAEKIRTSIFVDPDLEMIEGAKETGTDRIELYTEPFARDYPANPLKAVAPFAEAAKLAHQLGLGVNAGHDLNLKNLRFFHNHVPFLDEVSIGHALIADALYYGLRTTIQEYLSCLD